MVAVGCINNKCLMLQQTTKIVNVIFIIRMQYTKFYHNRTGFIEDITKTLRLTFSDT